MIIGQKAGSLKRKLNEGSGIGAVVSGSFSLVTSLEPKTVLDAKG